MKTFKLKRLEIIEEKDEDIVLNNIPLVDGLTINKENDENTWVIEAYTDRKYLEFFRTLKEENDEVLIQVKITKESNDPATFLTSIIGINEIGSQMNILFDGSIVDERKSKIQEMLTSLVEEGYQGESLLEKFKELL
ncbi:MAG TPA: YwpF family protein [Virgibacillus sp.]|nr:YwpF family protein [Virgibacillus sp.]